jgi:two-component system, OmpR family, phosphate regulon sensor histidine kinase PhoR
MARQLQASTSRLLEEKNKLAVVLADMADGVVMLDADGEIVLSNNNADRMLVPEPGGDARRLIDMLRSGMRTAAESGRELVDQSPLRGGGVAKVVYSPVRGEDGVLLGCVVLLHDITELTRLSEMKTEFVSNVSHELKTPLAAVKGLSEILLDGALHEAQGEKFLRSIGREVDRMTRLVTDLLNLSKIESGVVRMEVRAFDLGAMAADLVSGYRARPRAVPLQLAITVEAEADDAVLALGDADRVEQVIVNLLDNAVRYSPPEAAIGVTVRRVGGLCQVDVRDEGIGIPAEALPRIFDRFYRVDRARTREQGGTGLGLSIAYQIIERLQGRIWASSEGEGRGSTFSFVLPAARPQDLEVADELAEPFEERGRR